MNEQESGLTAVGRKYFADLQEKMRYYLAVAAGRCRQRRCKERRRRQRKKRAARKRAKRMSE